mgnify:FL=1|jgi:hypothetical protein
MTLQELQDCHPSDFLDSIIALFGENLIVGPRMISMETTEWVIPLLVPVGQGTKIVAKVPI